MLTVIAQDPNGWQAERPWRHDDDPWDFVWSLAAELDDDTAHWIVVDYTAHRVLYSGPHMAGVVRQLRKG